MKYLLKQTLFLSFAFFTISPILACTCIPIEDFCSSMYGDNYIFLGVIGESITDMKIAVEVIDEISQEIPFDQIELFGGGGYEAACIAGMSDLSEGDTLILSLYAGTDWLAGSPAEDQVTDSTFVRSLCGVHKLEYAQGEVYGPIYPEVQSMDYSAFVAEVALCIDFPSQTSNPGSDEPVFRVLPNPATTNFRVESLEVSIKEVALYNVAGQKLTPLQSNDQQFVVVNTDQLAAGIYLVHVTFVDQRVGVQKVVVVP